MSTHRSDPPAPQAADALALRPSRPRATRLSALRQLIGATTATPAGPEAAPASASRPDCRPDSGVDAAATADPLVTGMSLDTRQVVAGDLYAALPGAHRHGADFAAAAVAAGAVAVLTDPDGASRLGELAVPVLVHPEPRTVVGAVSASVFGTGASDEPLALYAVTGTNGKTTTTYLVTSLLAASGATTGLIGTIEILAGGTPVPSVLTTPEAPQVHSVLALMRERGVGATAMEVSSHALTYHRVDGVHFDVAGFTNLTQDHLDLHGTMEEYFAAKAQLFTPGQCRRAVILVDDAWGEAMAAHAVEQLGPDAVVTLRTTDGGGNGAGESTPGAGPVPSVVPGASAWRVTGVERDGLGHRFTLAGPDGERLRARTGLPGAFNVANAALAVLMVHAGGVGTAALQRLLETPDVLTPQVPGRMQVIGTAPHAIVDFAHNPDAMVRALEATRPVGEGRLLLVFGATGNRDAGKRPLMGAIAARMADVVIVTDDDPHDEDPASIRTAVLDGVRAACAEEGLDRVVEEVYPRADAIRRAVALARPQDSILVAGRGHEVWQEVAGVNLPLDDRVELATALRETGGPDDGRHDDQPGDGHDSTHDEHQEGEARA